MQAQSKWLGSYRVEVLIDKYGRVLHWQGRDSNWLKEGSESKEEDRRSLRYKYRRWCRGAGHLN